MTNRTRGPTTAIRVSWPIARHNALCSPLSARISHYVIRFLLTRPPGDIPMRAIEITQPGPPDVLKSCDRPMPVLKAGEVLIRVHAAGVNRPDVLQRTGNYPVP